MLYFCNGANNGASDGASDSADGSNEITIDGSNDEASNFA
jgi:hypothetical protein